MKKLSTVIILLFIFITFISCSKNVTLQVPKEETSATDEIKETNEPKDSEETSKEEVIKEETASSTETPPTTNEEISLPEVVNEPYYGFGFVNQIDLTSNPTLIVDEAEFYMYDEALQEAIKDGHAMLNEDNIYALPNPYYIRNNYDIVTNYPISENCVYYVCMHVAEYALSKELPNYELSSDLFEVNLDDFLKSLEYYRGLNSRLLTWFDVENGEVVKLHQQYIP